VKNPLVESPGVPTSKSTSRQLPWRLPSLDYFLSVIPKLHQLPLLPFTVKLHPSEYRAEGFELLEMALMLTPLGHALNALSLGW